MDVITRVSTMQQGLKPGQSWSLKNDFQYPIVIAATIIHLEPDVPSAESPSTPDAPATLEVFGTNAFFVDHCNPYHLYKGIDSHQCDAGERYQDSLDKRIAQSRAERAKGSR